MLRRIRKSVPPAELFPSVDTEQLYDGYDGRLALCRAVGSEHQEGGANGSRVGSILGFQSCEIIKVIGRYYNQSF